MSLKKSITRMFSVNFLTLISSIIIGFIVPKILSIETYSNVKTYTFYISYIGLLHFGFIDGMYIKYGGKEINHINKSELKNEHRIFTIIEAIITVIFLIFAFITKDLIIFLLAISIIPVNTLQFHQLFYQATGQFKKYAKSAYIYTIINLLLNIVLAIIFRNQNYILYCLATLFANAAVYIVLEYRFYRELREVKYHYNKNVWKNISIGFFILIGNLSVIFFYGIDRWFIKLFFDQIAFGYYSFAISMMGIINTLISAISIVFYNYLAKGEDEAQLNSLKKYLLIIGAGASLGYFALAGIVTLFLEKYVPSLNVIAISFASYPYMIIINALYVNLYKARKDEKNYVKVVGKMVLLSALYNIIAVVFFKSIESIAVATTISFITWYLYSKRDFKYLKIYLKEVIFLLINTIAFLLLANNTLWIVGGVLYLLILIITTLVLYKKEVVEMIKIVLKK